MPEILTSENSNSEEVQKKEGIEILGDERENHEDELKNKELLIPKEQQHFGHFRKIFKNQLPEGDGLIMSFPCSYQSKPKEFPIHGRMYLTLTMIGFNCSLFGYEKKFIFPLSQVVRIEKSSKFFANSIKVDTVTGEHHSFGSLKGRDKVYSLVFRVWRMNLDPEKVLPDAVETTSNMSPSDTTSESSADNSFNLSASQTSRDWTSSLTPANPSLVPVPCPCGEHKGKLLIDLELPLTVEQNFQLLFTENEWLRNFEESCKRSAKQSTPWSSGSLTTKTRVCKYNIELDKTFGPKSSDVTETQTCTLINSFGEGCVVQKEASNEGVPYADSFAVECSYCITRVSENSCRLKVHGGIIFRKSVFPFVKIVIERSTVAGLSSYYSILSERLRNDSLGLSSVISKSTLDFEKLDETTSEESLVIEEDLNLPLSESTIKFRERTRSISLSQRIGKEVKDTVSTAIDTNNRQVDT
ncbi:hypothetical protein FO519_001865 [Halicephalobus sp. NKZ332]|nr:hypothetical protein FO519_001865 [Halicephalobus sp. NKZ332]